MKTLEAAGLVIFTKSLPKKFLLMQHQNRWDLPKGHAEAGETLVETALRETEEETGIPASKLELDPDFEFLLEYDVTGKKRGSYHKKVSYFLAYIEAPVDVELTEHIGFSWFAWPPQEPIQKQTIDPLLSAIEKFWDAD